jgi:predicted nucleic acid-binding Zn ribbon protein
MNEQPATECVVCGGHIIAGTYPPVCSDDCRTEWDINVEFSRWVREEGKK